MSFEMFFLIVYYDLTRIVVAQLYTWLHRCQCVCVCHTVHFSLNMNLLQFILTPSRFLVVVCASIQLVCHSLRTIVEKTNLRSDEKCSERNSTKKPNSKNSICSMCYSRDELKNTHIRCIWAFCPNIHVKFSFPLILIMMFVIVFFSPAPALPNPKILAMNRNMPQFTKSLVDTEIHILTFTSNKKDTIEASEQQLFNVPKCLPTC